MDVGKWGSGGGRKRFLRLFLLSFLCLLKQGVRHAAASEGDYLPLMENQNLKEESEKSRNNLDSLFEDEEYKRGSSFFPLRGKKSPLDQSISTDQMLMSEEGSRENKRSQFFPLRGKKVPDELKRASSFMPMRGRKDSWTDDYYDAFDESDKRASSFMPMRGKKRSSGVIFPQLGRSGMYSIDLGEVMPLSISSVEQDKRTSSFVPARGKRSLTDPFRITFALNSDTDTVAATENNNEVNVSRSEETTQHHISKRSVSFMPMRGRSLENSSGFGGGKIATSLVDKKQHSFLPIRGRREAESNESYFTDDDFLSAENKRGASFMPIRGRRTNQNTDDLELDAEDKRAQSFMPMRGRRLFYPHLNFDASSLQDSSSKRASSFTPMRGRRLFYPHLNFGASSLTAPNSKRASSFTPMRGRRSWDEGFDENNWMDDNVNPQFEFLDKKASAFTPMRGRRTVNEEESSSEEDGSDKRTAFMSMRGRRTSIVEDLETPNAKKSSSFMPMRGRKTFDDNEEHADDFEMKDKRASSFTPMRGRREFSDLGDSNSYYHPYPFLMAGIGSSLMSRPYGGKIRGFVNQKKKLKINWDSVKRAFHATRGKRQDDVNDFVNTLKHHYFSGMPELVNEESTEPNSEEKTNSRVKRSIIRSSVSFHPQRQYIALKRPMSFFATRGKRFDASPTDKDSRMR